MKVQELIDKINSATNCCSLWQAEEYVEEGVKLVASNLNIDEHRWFTVATDVYKLEDGYVGITGPSQLRSEGMVWSDCNYMCIAEEYEEFTTIAYRPKK